MAGVDFRQFIGPAARELLGEPNEHLSSKDELRFGTNGSVSVILTGERRGTWYDHEAEIGGGVLDLLRERKKLVNGVALDWLRDKLGADIPDDRTEAVDSRAKGDIVATYPYVDQDGVLLFEVCRRHPKTFSQRSPTGTGGWIWTVKGVKRVPYRLPELLKSDPAKPVFLVEGEKDVDALRSIGLTASCNSGGAGKWSKALNSHFKGRDVIVLPDNDEAGKSHASVITGLLRGVAARLRVLQLPDLPPKGDSSDWLKAGGTAEKLLALLGSAEDLTAPPAGDATADADMEGLLLNEDGIALSFARSYQHSLRYCHHACSWFVWTGSYWRREETKLAFSWAREICRKAALGLPADDKLKHTLAKAAVAAAVERFAQSDRTFAVTAETWDRDPWLLGTPGGTVNLKTGELSPAVRSDHITKHTSVAPAPKGTPHPVWTKFLHEATNGDVDLQHFLMRLAGYCLTGDISEEVLAFLYGEGGGGKGTFLSVLVGILGDYAVSVPIEVFTAGSKINLEYYRAQMAGARLVTASETEAGATWAESQIKEMTGNETPLSARQPYGKVFTFKPAFKIILVGNHAPKLKGKSKAMERRLRVTPFNHRPASADNTLKDRLRAEFPAILRSIIEGCLDWQAEGLGTCAAVSGLTGDYFEQQDAFGRWLEERCILDKSLSSKTGLVHADFNAWAKANTEDTLNNNEFAELIERTSGLSRVKNNGVRLIRGIGLKVPHAERDE